MGKPYWTRITDQEPRNGVLWIRGRHYLTRKTAKIPHCAYCGRPMDHYIRVDRYGHPKWCRETGINGRQCSDYIAPDAGSDNVEEEP